MQTILHLMSSGATSGSYSRLLGKQVLEGLSGLLKDPHVISHDLIKESVPYIDASFLEALMTGKTDHLGVAISDRFTDEVLSADWLIVEAPMYNFGIPAVLKAWIDCIVRAGKTFQYGSNGPEGLLKGKKAILVISRGGIYTEEAYKAFDFQEAYLRTVLGFIGIKDVHSIIVEGVALGAQQADDAVKKAEKELTHLLASIQGSLI